jgi:hypothetical protein
MAPVSEFEVGGLALALRPLVSSSSQLNLTSTRFQALSLTNCSGYWQNDDHQTASAVIGIYGSLNTNPLTVTVDTAKVSYHDRCNEWLRWMIYSVCLSRWVGGR